jgi:hypothetical protein
VLIMHGRRASMKGTGDAKNEALSDAITHGQRRPNSRPTRATTSFVYARSYVE